MPGLERGDTLAVDQHHGDSLAATLDTVESQHQISTRKLVASDAWSASTLTWNTRPATSTTLGSWTPTSGQTVEIDVTSAVEAQRLADGGFSVAITTTSAVGIVAYGSFEHTEAAFRPELAAG